MSKASDAAIVTPEEWAGIQKERSKIKPTKNPCDCGDCTPTKIKHWFCDQCGQGPYRYTGYDPGAYPIQRPLFARMKSWYSTTDNKWIYEQRYACSKGCLEKEDGVITSELIELAGKRPDLREAIMSEVEQKRMAPTMAHDDLKEIKPSDGGAYTPGPDDL